VRSYIEKNKCIIDNLDLRPIGIECFLNDGELTMGDYKMKNSNFINVGAIFSIKP
jgi:hypothetical protein